MNRKIIIGSRGSDLALWQAHFVQNQLNALGCESEIHIIKTRGDKIQHLSFEKMEGKGFFTKEIEDALLNQQIDLAIHSHKDLETNQPEGLKVAAVSYRENPAEWLLIRKEAVDKLQLMSLKQNAVVGTSAARRKSQMLFYRNDIELKDLRGNVPTRVEKLRQGNYDAILLAAAGVSRLKLDLSDFELVELDPRVFVPAPAQGVLAYQIRENDLEIEAILQKINDTSVAKSIGIERKILNLLHGGCQVPFGAYCQTDSSGTHLWAYYASGEAQKRRLYIHSAKGDFDFENTLSQLRMPHQKSVLFTRLLNEQSGVKELLLNAGVKVQEQSFIQIAALPQTPVQLEQFNWLFFTSPNAVEHFAQLHETFSQHQLAALGRGTAAALRERGFKVAFEGDGSTDHIAVNFKEILGNQRALILCAEAGLRSVQSALKPESFTELAVYHTELAPYQLSAIPEIIAFTSPSNVEGFFAQNQLPVSAKVLAIGSATAAALKAHGVDNVLISWQSSEQALADIILGLK
jgi:hydroxymethylbilane synthase